MTKKRIIALVIVLLILVVDQWIKIWVKTHMCLGDSIRLADWAYIAFTENKGMAFGMDFFGTMALCCFRMVAIGFLVWFLFKVTRMPKIKWGFIVLLSMVVAGAIGNIVDNVFYGLIFSDSPGYVPSHLVAMGTGYGSVFEGRVVDMFYFPMIRTSWPDWMPLCGGERFVFFSPVFNFADAAISCGGVLIVACYYKTLNVLLSHGPKAKACHEEQAESEKEEAHD